MLITVIHTTPATIASTQNLIKKEIPDAQVYNILDDSILPDMKSKNNIPWVRERWLSYAETAMRNGSDLVLSACSTVGDFADEANTILPIPVYRIDEAMAREAVKRGGHIYVFATLESTLSPTSKLISRIAHEENARCSLDSFLVEGAYDSLMNGDPNHHNELIMDAVSKVKDKADSIVLAQASMAGALASADEETAKKILTSPVLAIQAIKKQFSKT